MKKIAHNFFYQSLFQLTKILLPIITIPIVSNALGPEGIGIYSYSNSVAQYFVLLSGLGISLYANREIAIKWKKKEAISIIFWEIFCLKGITTALFLFIYLGVVLFLDNSIFFLAQSLIVISVFFDVSWFFMGIEDFKKTSMSTLAVQIISFICILCFVNDPQDALIYTLIQAGSVLLSQLLVWPFLKKYISLSKISFKNMLRHLKGSFEFFIPQIAIMLYTNLNKTILGVTLGSMFVGYYTNSLQLNTVFITVITTLDVVLLPHMSGLFAENNENKIIEMMKKTIHLQLFFSIPIMFGILTVYDKLIPWFFGEKFLFINKVVPVFSVLIVIIPLGMSISRQYLMPIGKIKEYNKSVILGAILNIILNFILLPLFGFFGVVFANIISEFFVTVVRTKSFLRNTGFKFEKKYIFINVLCGLVMCIVVRFITKDFAPNVITNIIQMLIASSIYFFLTSILKTNPLFEFIKTKYMSRK
jgi:O-antigen/teichoic acid export membrane protein